MTTCWKELPLVPEPAVRTVRFADALAASESDTFISPKSQIPHTNDIEAETIYFMANHRASGGIQSKYASAFRNSHAYHSGTIYSIVARREALIQNFDPTANPRITSRACRDNPKRGR